MNKNDAISKILSHFAQHPMLTFSFKQFNKFSQEYINIFPPESLKFLDILVKEELIEVLNQGKTFKITPKGYEIHESGGWNKYIFELEKEKKNKMEFESAQLKLTHAQLDSLKWSKIFSIIALILSFLAFLFSIFRSNE